MLQVGVKTNHEKKGVARLIASCATLFCLGDKSVYFHTVYPKDPIMME